MSPLQQYSTVQYSTGCVPPAAVAEQRPDVVTTVGPAVVGMSWSHPARPGLVQEEPAAHILCKGCTKENNKCIKKCRFLFFAILSAFTIYLSSKGWGSFEKFAT